VPGRAACAVRAGHRRLPPAAKHDLQAWPIYHCKSDSIEAHLSIVFAALALSRWIEDVPGWSIRKFVRTTCRYRTIQIQARLDTITGDEVREAVLRGLCDAAFDTQLLERAIEEHVF
jgi:hypothetical protein